jgi:hypothetical protein
MSETAAERAAAEAAAQGLPPTIQDPVVLDKIAAIFLAAEAAQREFGTPASRRATPPVPNRTEREETPMAETTTPLEYIGAVFASPTLTSKEKIVALAYADRGCGDPMYLTHSQLATLTGIRSKSTIGRMVRSLVQGGWLVPVRADVKRAGRGFRLAVPDNTPEPARV